MLKNRRMPLWSAPTPRDAERERVEGLHSENDEALSRFAEELDKICNDIAEETVISPQNLLKAKSVIESAMNVGDFNEIQKDLMKFVIRQIERRTSCYTRNFDDQALN